MSPAAATWTSLAALAALALAHVIGAPSARAATIYGQDFDGLASGALDGQDGWLGDGWPLGGVVVQDAIAVSGQALAIRGEARRFGTFVDASTSPQQRVSLAFRMDETIVDVTGANVDFQHDVHIRGPGADLEGFFVYKGTRNGVGDVVRDRFEVRGATTILGPAPVADVWYDIQFDFDFALGTMDVLVTQDGSVFWDPVAVSFVPNGHVNMIEFTADELVTLFVDDVLVEGTVPPTVPEPAALGLVALAGATFGGARRRARGVGR